MVPLFWATLYIVIFCVQKWTWLDAVPIQRTRRQRVRIPLTTNRQQVRGLLRRPCLWLSVYMCNSPLIQYSNYTGRGKQPPLHCRDVKISRTTWFRDHFYSGLGLMKYRSRSHTFWSRGLKSILFSSRVTTSDCVLCYYSHLVIVNILLVKKSSSTSTIRSLLR